MEYFLFSFFRCFLHQYLFCSARAIFLVRLIYWGKRKARISVDYNETRVVYFSPTSPTLFIAFSIFASPSLSPSLCPSLSFSPYLSLYHFIYVVPISRSLSYSRTSLNVIKIKRKKHCASSLAGRLASTLVACPF